MSTQILASFSPSEPSRDAAKQDSNSTLVSSSSNVKISQEMISVPDNLSKESISFDQTTTSASKKASLGKSRLTSPNKRLASSLGLDLSSSEDSEADEKSPPKLGNRKSPRKLTKNNKNDSVKPVRKKIQLGHSVEEHVEEYVFKN